jgi:arylsulfatase A-like enzyme
LTTDIPVTVADIFPTVARAADAHYIPEAAMDGQDVLTLLQDTGRSYERPLFWHYPHYSNQGGKPGAAIRRGKWKLIYYYEDESIELFDLFSDPRELKNISGSELLVSKELKNQLLQWLKQNNASAPRPNTGYQPGIKK